MSDITLVTDHGSAAATNERTPAALAVLRAADHRRMRWLNGGGWTTEVLAWPDRDDWEWRLSVADIEHGGPFSVLPGVDRTIALLQGNGCVLRVAEGPAVTIAERYEPFDFRGDEVTTCALIDGSVQDLNLMVRRSGAPRKLDFVEVVDSIELIETKMAIVLSGCLRLGGQQLSRLDAVRFDVGSPGVVVSRVGTEQATVGIVR